MNIIDNIVKWQEERLLDKQEFNSFNELTNISEELLESLGYQISKELRPEFKEQLLNSITELTTKLKIPTVDIKEEDVVDAYADIIVFSIGALLKLGYEPTKVLEETYKEINSRTGKIVDGKFQKDVSNEAKSKWVKADYSKAKRN